MDDVAVHPAGLPDGGAWHVIELCAGAGGLGLGIELAVPGSRGVAYVEREAAAAATLVTRMEAGDLAPAPVWSDLATFDARPWRGRVHCVASGDPCQPNSVAGKGLGAADERFLIDQMLRVIDEARPLRLFRENVPGNAAGQLAALVGPLEQMGYRVECGIFSSAATGNSHGRKRLVIMADRADGAGWLYPRPWRPGEDAVVARGSGERVVDAVGARWSATGRRSALDAGQEPFARSGELADPDSADAQRGGRGGDTGGRQVEARHARLVGGGLGAFFAPGPADPRWSALLDADPLFQPALGRIDFWAIARRNCGLPPLERAIGRRGGMARDLDAATTAAVKREVRRIADAMADRVERLRQLGNGVDPVAAWDAWCNLDARHRAWRERVAGDVVLAA